ncbi:MAG: DUF192 domain-containing protein [Treponema sp.]|nr:DUF192 domain-containing protein [Treponema sp.]
MRKSISLPVFLMAAILSFISCSAKKYNLPVRQLVIFSQQGSGNETALYVDAELAVKEEERNYGFMNRKNIPDGTGMLFVFEKDQILHFWMKNTPHPLSIAYIDSTGIIADILDMTPFSEASISSSRSVRYALEVPQGWFKKNGIKEGDRVEWTGPDNQVLPLRGIK